jgi:hypothetical protein
MSTVSSKDNKDDKFVLDYSRRKHSQSSHEVSRDDMVMKNYQGELEKGLKNLVGPAFLGCGAMGCFIGIAQSLKTRSTFKNRPRKLLITSFINTIGKQSSFYANAGASLGLLYCLTKRGVNFIFEEDLQGMSDINKQLIYGFVTGAIFKSTRGLLPALLSGVMMSGVCAGGSIFATKYWEKLKFLE